MVVVGLIEAAAMNVKLVPLNVVKQKIVVETVLMIVQPP